MTLVNLDLDKDGRVIGPRNDKMLIVDADTIVYASCSVCEYELPDGGFDINIHEALAHAEDKINRIVDAVEGKEENLHLHFTGGKASFRYQLLADAFPDEPEMHYKFKRKKKKVPEGLHQLKVLLNEKHKGDIHYEWEADDQVVFDKKKYGDDAILIAVDKDVLYNVPGKHYNYYESRLYNIDPKWVEVNSDEARFDQYIQAITGDKSDNIPGIKGIGPAKARKFLVDGMDEDELYQGVLNAYETHHKRLDISPEDMAILNIRLVNMHQLTDEGVVLWEQV